MRSFIAQSATYLLLVTSPVYAQSELLSCEPLDITVLRVEPPPSQYAAFCLATPEHCVVTGEAMIVLDRSRFDTLNCVNRAVNHEISLDSDISCHGSEEVWALPKDDCGDCEDLALEKRLRLVNQGFPSASMMIAIVHHTEKFFPHAILTVETNRGTLVLDNLSDDVACWDVVPYEFERRERPDGAWTRFKRPN